MWGRRDERGAGGFGETRVDRFGASCAKIFFANKSSTFSTCGPSSSGDWLLLHQIRFRTLMARSSCSCNNPLRAHCATCIDASHQTSPHEHDACCRDVASMHAVARGSPFKPTQECLPAPPSARVRRPAWQSEITKIIEQRIWYTERSSRMIEGGGDTRGSRRGSAGRGW